MQIVAVTFVCWNNGKLEYGEKPYFYLDPYMLNVGDLAFIHNSRDWGVVKIHRTLSPSDPVVSRVAKPIMGAAHLDEAKLVGIEDKLSEFREQSKSLRIKMAIDDVLLGNVHVPTKKRRNASNLEYIDYEAE